MSKFKVGDKVVVTKSRDESDSERNRIGKTFTIISVSPSRYIYMEPFGIYNLDEEAFEHEEVYNSPLYQALL